MKSKLNKREFKEMKSAQAVITKKAKSPNFWKTLPKAIAEANRMKI